MSCSPARRALALSLTLFVCAACGSTANPDKPDAATPFAPGSPWPKFRGDSVQDGLSSLHPEPSGAALWTFTTGKCVFSSPVVAADETIYFGSADRYFYALAADGSLKWKLITGEIIDSSGLLDNQGRIYFGSGDGMLRALDAATGSPAWTLAADAPSVNGAYINWFEGNVALTPDGELFVPNDNFFLYRVDRASGTFDRHIKMPDQTWSLPAIDPSAGPSVGATSGDLYVGNNNVVSFLGDNFFAFNENGTQLWSDLTLGTIAASPMIDGNLVVVGGFDGYVRAYDRTKRSVAWSYGARDHIYASPALLPDGTIIQAAADGTVYALDPTSGALRWTFDTTEPIRSSPAVDAEGHVYFGSGEGKLFVLNADGTLRYSVQLIDADRNDLNASPALGNQAVYIGGESGEVFGVPYDYCLAGGAGVSDARCSTTADTFPPDSAQLRYTTAFGATPSTPPQSIDPNQPVVFSLVVRQGGKSQLAILDANSVTATTLPPTPLTTEVAGDGKFLVVTPQTAWLAAADGTVTITLSAPYLVDLDRAGLKLSGGKPGGTATTNFQVSVAPSDGNASFVLPIPQNPGDPTGTWEVSRLSLPLPTLLPSYNQIGFDSLQYVVGLVEGDGTSGVAWMVGATLAAGQDVTIIDPTTKALFPLSFTYAGGFLTMQNEDGLRVEIMNATIPFRSFRVAAHVGAGGVAAGPLRLTGSAICAQIPTYGLFLQQLGLCNPETDVLEVIGAANLTPFGTGGLTQAPAGVGTVSWTASAASVSATLQGSTLRLADHVYAILLVDAQANTPVTLDYGLATTRTAAADGTLQTVTVPLTGHTVPASVRAYLLVDAYPAAKTTLTIP